MASFVVLTSPDGRDKEHFLTRVVRDGFSLTAFLVPVLWLFFHRLWLTGSIALLLQVLGFRLFGLDGLEWAGVGLLFVVSTLTALEGRMLYVRLLEAKGWKAADIVSARNLGDAEDIYFSDVEATDMTDGDASAKKQPFVTGRPARARPSDTDMFGFYDPEGGRK